VDRVIGEEFVDALNRRQRITKASLIRAARERFDRQLAIALGRTAGNLSPAVQDDRVAFRCIEYGQPPTDEELLVAWSEVESALAHLFAMEQLHRTLRGATRVVAQRPLQFECGDVNVRAVPDLIAFSDTAPPLIVDWKVHATGTRDSRLQLALYGLALLRCKPHWDFPAALRTWIPSDLRLVEVQLLSSNEREYHLTEGDCNDVDDHIATTATEILAAKGGLSNAELSPQDFPVTTQPSLCQRCSFLKLCWEKADGRP
jgi:hypothetical protein